MPPTTGSTKLTKKQKKQVKADQKRARQNAKLNKKKGSKAAKEKHHSDPIMISRQNSFSKTGSTRGSSLDRDPIKEQHGGGGRFGGKSYSNGVRKSQGPVDLDDYDEAYASDENRSAGKSPRLSHQQLQQFDSHHANSNGYGGMHGLYQGRKPHNMTRLANGQLVPMDNIASPVSSTSDFCLSTDVEDNEYNSMRRGSSLPPMDQYGHSTNQGVKYPFSPALSSPTSYTTDDEHALFPALQTDDEGEERGRHQFMGNSPSPASSRGAPRRVPPTPEDEMGPGRIRIVPMAHETEEDMLAWTPTGSETAGSANSATGEQASLLSSPRFTFQGDESKNGSHKINGDRALSPHPDLAKNSAAPNGSDQVGKTGNNAHYLASSSHPPPPPPPPRRKSGHHDVGHHSNVMIPPPPETSPPAKVNRGYTQGGNVGRDPDERRDDEPVASNFADFDGHAFIAQSEDSDDIESVTPLVLQKKNVVDKSPSRNAAAQSNQASSSKSATSPKSPLAALLAHKNDKKNTTTTNTANREKVSSASVNSEPVITSSYLRQYHKNRSTKDNGVKSPESELSAEVPNNIQPSKSGEGNRLRSVRSGGSQRSISRHRDLDSQSIHSTGGQSAASAAKDKLRERRRRKEKEAAIASGSPRSKSSSRRSHRSRSAAVGSDEEGSDAAESWLFDEVTGTLGPRGIAADMESLGGRSNRSKSDRSTGNKSHRSHRSHRSHKSHRSSTSHRSSSRRHKSSSDQSVESRTSRNSRSSRYSHRSSRSTRSHLSTMSDASRSVANDLLRLEMQLAMVGSQNASSSVGGDEFGGSSVGGASNTNSYASRSTNRSTSVAARRAAAITKRSKITVVAPPGKLGIILANKADSKGTVVSGVRTSSVLAEKISPGDRIIAIDSEDVSRMTVSEITTIMARKGDFERMLTVLTVPKQQQQSMPTTSSIASESEAGSMMNSSIVLYGTDAPRRR